MKQSLKSAGVLAVVPARGGSEGIPRKNLARVGGLSLIARTAKVIAELGWITQAVISTDDAEMLEEGRRFGLAAPFVRPAELSHGTAAAADVLFHAWVESEQHYEARFDYALYLQPTSPLRRPDDIARTLEALMASKFDTATTVSRTPAHFVPEKCHLVSEDGALKHYLPEGRDIVARQQIRPYFSCNGAVYALRRDPFFRTKQIIGDSTLAVILDRPLVNIDDPFELEVAEWMLSKQNNR